MLSDPLRAIAAQDFLGVPVEVHPVLDSTNDEAFRRARDGAPEGLVVVAEAQTAGRGRQGRVWLDTPGRSLLFSVLLKPSIPLPSFPLLSLALAGAIAEAGQDAAKGARLEVKWPNDVLCAGRKVSGVLAESRSPAPGRESGAPPAGAPGGAPLLVIGAGVNGNQLEEDFPPEIRGRATSLRIARGGAPVDLAVLFGAILSRFDESLALARGGDPRPLFERVRPWLPERGSPVRVVLGERAVEGSLEEVTVTGALRVRDRTSGRMETLVAGALE